jgi:hypothetical protein
LANPLNNSVMVSNCIASDKLRTTFPESVIDGASMVQPSRTRTSESARIESEEVARRMAKVKNCLLVTDEAVLIAAVYYMRLVFFKLVTVYIGRAYYRCHGGTTAFCGRAWTIPSQ